jgi:hypothetical protein
MNFSDIKYEEENVPKNVSEIAKICLDTQTTRSRHPEALNFGHVSYPFFRKRCQA